MAYYPVFLELADRSCLVIGGGRVGERKVIGLLAVEANVTVLSPTLTAHLKQLAGEQQIQHIKRAYQLGDLAGYQLVFAASGDSEVNAAVFQEGQERGVWVNAADDPAHCDFILPSVLRRGALVVAVATGGAAPALARVIREELETYFTADYTVLVQVTAEVRSELQQRGCFSDGDTWHAALGDRDFRRLISRGLREEAKTRLLEQLQGEACR